MHEVSDIDKFLAHPVKGVSIVFAIFFIVSGGLHVWQSQRHKSWSYTWPLPCACIVTTAGFICREVTAHGHYEDELASAVQGLFYTASPVFAFPLYFVVLHLLSTHPSVVWGPPWLHFAVTSCFNTAIISCTAQGASTYFSPNASEGSVSSGLALIKASLILQIVMNVGFIYILHLLHSRGQRTRDRLMIEISFLSMIGLLLVRNIFRTIQIFASPLSAIWLKEVYFYVFEACLLLAFTTIFHLMHPANFQEYTCEGRSSERRDS